MSPESGLPPDPKAIAAAEAGLAALKQGDYPRAIALLETISLPAKHPLNIKAQMGLVIAYTRNRDPQQAISLCRQLAQHPNPQVQEWSDRTLANLARRYPQWADVATGEGTTVSQPPATTVGGINTSTESDVDLTGFMPFDGSVAPPQPFPATTDTSDATGFVSFDATNQAFGEPATTRDRLNSPIANTPMAEPKRPQSTPGMPAPQSAQNTIDAVFSPSVAPSEPFQPSWRQAGRAKQWQPLGKVDVTKLLVAQVMTAIALFWVLQQLAYWSKIAFMTVVSHITFLQIPYVMFSPPFWSVIWVLVILLVASRWLLDGLLQFAYGLKPLSLSQLANDSPETVQSLNRFCRQRKIPLPSLGIIPVAAPIAFSYGCLPRFTRTVVSEGLLAQLADDEIATIYAMEVGHIAHRTTPLMSVVMTLIQIPYTIYWLLAHWGDRQSSRLIQELVSLVAAISYGLYAGLRWLGLWLSRQRVYYADRAGAELTGNPNGLTRSLLKIAIGTAKDVAQQGKTSYLLEGFDLLTPLGHYHATLLGSLYHYTPFEPILTWEWMNPYRHWLSLSNSHPPTGDRLNLLALYARHWHLPAELDFNATQQATVSRQQRSGFTARQWRAIMLQGAPFFGLGFGLAVAYSFSMLGWLGWKLGITGLAWMYGDHAILNGLPMVGFSLGTFIRINPFFPDIKLPAARSVTTTFALPQLLQDPSALPVNSPTVRLEGTLLGRTGISNMLGQDLLLQTTTGLIRLHCLSSLGPIGNLIRRDVHFTDLQQQEVAASGWLRRGATFWLDVDTLRTTGGRTSRSNAPIWSTILGAVAAAWGIYTILRGGIF